MSDDEEIVLLWWLLRNRLKRKRSSTDYQPSTHRNDRTSGKEKSSTRRFEKVKKERLSSSSVSSSTDDMDDMEENTAENDISEEDATDTIKSEDVNPDSASQDDSNSLHESSLTKPADKFIKIEPADLSSYDINTASTSNFIYHNIKEEAIIEDEDFEKPSTSHLNCDITSNSESADTNIYIKIEPHDSPSHEDNTVSSTNIKDEPFEEDKFEAVILNTLLGAPKAFLVSECSHESLNVNESTERAESSLRNFLDANLNTKFCEDIYQETNKSQQSSDLDLSFTKLLPVSNNNFNNLFENDASILDPNYLEECQVSPERYVKTSDFDAAVAEDRAQENKVDKIIIEAETELNDGDGENEVGVTEIGILDNTQEHPKKGRKIPSQNRHSIKQKCQKGKIKLSKEFRQYLCNCACLDKLGLEKAKEEYYKFYAAESHSAQRALICSMVRECPVKRKRVKESNKRNYTREYVVNGVTVCKKFFLETFRISSGKVDVAVKCKKRPEGVKDLRGVGGGKN